MSNHMKDWESMNAQSSMTPPARTMQTYRKPKWKEINWKQAELYVNRLQVRIVKAVQADKWRLVKRLQKLITNSFYAKVLAVKRVITNKGKNTPGIDGDIWSTDEDKIQAVYNLTTSSYKAKPLKRTYIEKYGKKEKRPLGIPTMTDRAMQGLQLLALAPIAETTADKVSFGFRQNRCAQDAMEYMFKLLSRKTSPEWILEGDIKGCFDNISHDWMLENIPSDKRIMRQFLRCGYVENKRLFPTTEGSPQGGLISPTYANMTLDGLERLFSALVSVKRMKQIDATPEQTGTNVCNNKGYDIEFKNVVFSYNEEPVLKGVSFVAKQGEVTALVGPSGSGKSTASKLAARFWDADSGTITLGGVDVKTVEPETLFKNYAIVFQDVMLFDETVMENIRLGWGDATDEEVMAAARAAQCEEFIQRLPQGYQTNIGENGSALSGGERQRISIARALLKNAPIVLLDEATASMDAESETLIQDALSVLLKDKTVMVIAHRMRTVANADKIVVLDDGKVSEMGTPAALMKKGGLYAHLVELQQGK